VRFSVILASKDFGAIQYTDTVGSVAGWSKTLNGAYESEDGTWGVYKFVDEKESGARLFTANTGNICQIFEAHPLFNAYMLTSDNVTDLLPNGRSEDRKFQVKCRETEAAWFGSMVFRTLRNPSTK
jgi:hypothetical protein